MGKVSNDEARLAGNILNVNWKEVIFDQLKRGMEAELEEHGTASKDLDVTRDDLIKVAKIALSHLRENPKYYDYLEAMEKKIKKESFEGPSPINLSLISDKTLGVIADTLGFDLTAVQPDEFRLGIVEELDNMMVYTTAALNNEKLARAATQAWDNLQTHPSFYSAPPQQDFAHPLTGKQFAGDHVQYENLQRYIDEVINEDFASAVAKLKASPANLWNAAKTKLIKSSGMFKGLLNKAAAKIESGAAKLLPLVKMIKQAEAESGEKLPINPTMQAAQNLQSEVTQAMAEINQQQSAIAKLPAAQPAQQEAAARIFTSILDEGIAGARKKNKQALNEALTPMVIVGFILALIGGIPMLIKALHTLAKKMGLEKTANMLSHAHHVAHTFEQKAIDYIIPDILSYKLYTKFWHAGIKVRGSHAFDKPIEYEKYRAGEDHVRETVEGIIYKILLVWFFAQGVKGAFHAGVSMLGVAEGAASSVKAVEIAAAVTQVADILGPDDLLDGDAG